MFSNPLAPPHDRRLLSSFSEHFALHQCSSETEQLAALAAAFARLPYENLTKIIKAAESTSPGEARRPPEEVFRDHLAFGTGGTCFSLTATLRHLVRSMGLPADPILADRSYGANTHCALLVRIEGRPHLVDPGFLILRPIPLDSIGARELSGSPPGLSLVRQPGTANLDLYSLHPGRRAYRLTYKTEPVDAGEFFRVWDESFGWDMMRYPLLAGIQDSCQLYLRGKFFQVRTGQALQRAGVASGDLAAHISSQFRIDPSVVSRALSILKDQGEPYG